MNVRLCAVVAALAVAAVAWSQPQPPGGGNNAGSGSQQQPPPPGGGNDAGLGMRMQGGPPHGDVMMENFFPPEMVMHHQKDIALTTDQQTAMRTELKNMAGDFTELQWQQTAEEDALQTLLKQDHPDEKQVLAQLDKVLKIENDLKRMQLGTLVRIKNILTPEQQAKLAELKKKHEGDRRGSEGLSPRGERDGNRPNGPSRGPGGDTKTPPPAIGPAGGEEN